MILSVKGSISATSFLLFFVYMLCLQACAVGTRNVSTMRCIESEKQALLAFKKSLVDPGNMLASWTSGEEDCCRWSRVGCDNLTGHVIKLDLDPFHAEEWSQGRIHGEISPSLLQLSHLNHLDLSGNLSMLQYLYLSNNEHTKADNFEWLAKLSSLRVLMLDSVDFSIAEDWYQVIKVHPSLSTLVLNGCRFPKFDPSAASLISSSNSISKLSLGANTFFDPSILSWLFDLSTSLVYVDIVYSGLRGPIPESIGELIWLEHLDLHGNLIEGIPTSFSQICHLKVLDLSSNSLSQPIDDIFQNMMCAKNSLEELDLAQNKLTGSFPNISEFRSLRVLSLSNNLLNGSFSTERFGNSAKLVSLYAKSNKFIGPLLDFENLPSLEELVVSNNSLNGSIPISIGKLSNLTVFDVSHNFFDGFVTEAHFSTLSKLHKLRLSYNFLTFNISSDFVPSFQLNFILLRFCKIGPKFPSWLQSQRKFYVLDISNAQISDVVPDWFWNLPSSVEYLNLSHNHLYGKIPNLSLEVLDHSMFYLGSNHFDGPIPQFLSDSSYLNLRNNLFSGSLSFLCKHSPLNYLDLSYNMLSGSLTDCWVHLPQLFALILENNSFSGTIPSSMGFLAELQTLHLRNNNLTGELPSSFRNCSYLQVLDVGENRLTGQLPSWIGESLTGLSVLRLRSNRFYGKINTAICLLRFIQILDLSFNNLSGFIPACVNKFVVMSSNRSFDITMPYYQVTFSEIFTEETENNFNYASVVWKGVEQEYMKTLGLLKLIDLSSNSLKGNIPSEITNLSALVSLNLSRNKLSGTIPDEIGHIKELQVLDLSHNQVFGKIPSSLADINRLSVLDLSHNKLSGKIPKSTQLQSFNPSAYEENSGLCGCPLPVKCTGDNDECSKDKIKQEATIDSSSNGDNAKEDERLFDRSSFYGGMGAGFAAGFSGFCSILVMSKSWRCSYFRFLNKMRNYLHLIIELEMARRG